MQKVEPLGLRELQRLAAAALGAQQRLADPPVQPHLVVDRFARGLELFLMTAPGGVEQLANDAVVQIDHFVGDSGRALDGDRHGRGISPLGLELGEVGRRHLATFAGDLEEAGLKDCPIDADGKVQRPPGLQTFDVLAHVPRVRLDRRLAQPGQPCRLAAVTALEQLVQSLMMLIRQRVGQRGVDAPIGAGDGLGADALDHVGGGQQQALPPQAGDQRGGQHDALVDLPRQLVQAVNGEAIVLRCSEALQAQVGLQFEQVLAARLGPLAVSAPGIRGHLDLGGHHPQQGHERCRICPQDRAGEPKVAKLDSETQPVRRPAPLADECQVGIAEGVSRISSSRASGIATRLSYSAAVRIERRGMPYLARFAVALAERAAGGAGLRR